MVIHMKFEKFYQYLTLFLVGAVVLIMEIGGARLLAPFFGSTIYVWSSLITVTLGFLTLGYYFGGVVGDKYKSFQLWYGIIASASTLAIFLLKINRYLLVFSDNFGFKWGPLVASILIFALPLVFYSMSGPILIRLFSLKIDKSGSISGNIFAISTLGSLFGALLAGFMLIPNYSLALVLLVSNLILGILAIIGLILEKTKWSLLVFFALALLLVYFLPIFNINSENKVTIIHSEPSFYADLKVAQMQNVDMLLMDGSAQSVFSRLENQSFAYEALQINKQLVDMSDDAKILVLGYGVGMVGEVFSEKFAIDYVELDPKMIELSKDYFDYNLDDNDEMYIADARQFLRQTDKKYDVVYIDLYHSSVIPYHTHTKEALELLKTRLNDNALVFCNILGEKDSALLQSLAMTMNSVFKNIYFSSTQDGFANILAYATDNDDFVPDFSFRHKEISISTDQAVLITDDKNPLDRLSSERLDGFLSATKEVLGYEAMFAI
ncbi:hypothetical protein C0583_04720 [Candidatus Parcubacteria bacterium]|nr:MAG: hypothetical protein C0583_04720 [Candidatus Parcubacteria bacterium]